MWGDDVYNHSACIPFDSLELDQLFALERLAFCPLIAVKAMAAINAAAEMAMSLPCAVAATIAIAMDAPRAIPVLDALDVSTSISSFILQRSNRRLLPYWLS